MVKTDYLIGISYYRTRTVYNYVGSIIGFGVYTFFSPDPSLLIRLVGQLGNIVGSQLVAVAFMLVPKLFVRVSLSKLFKFSVIKLTLSHTENYWLPKRKILSHPSYFVADHDNYPRACLYTKQAYSVRESFFVCSCH